MPPPKMLAELSSIVLPVIVIGASRGVDRRRRRTAELLMMVQSVTVNVPGVVDAAATSRRSRCSVIAAIVTVSVPLVEDAAASPPNCCR